MKKVLVVVVVLFLLLAGAGLWLWHVMGPGEAALLVPSDTVALVSVPDLPRSIFRWPQTALAKIGFEPEMRTFLEKPLNLLSKTHGGNDAAQVLLQLKPRRIFVALVSISPKDVSAVLGFQYWGSKGDHDAAIARLREELLRGQPAQEVKRETYEGDEITSITYTIGTIGQTIPVKGTLYSARHGNWGFLANNLANIQDALDRASGRAKTPSLAENAKFRETNSQLLISPDFLFFVQPQALVDTLLSVGQALGAQSIPAQVEEIKKIQAFGASLKLDGENMRDRLFLLHSAPPEIGSFTHAPIKLTSADTTVYFDFLTQLDKLKSLGSNPAYASAVANNPVLSSPIFQLLPDAFGPEAAISLVWPANTIKPEAVAALQVKDAAKADEALHYLLTSFPGSTMSENEGQTYYVFPSKIPFFNPTVTMTKGFFLAGLDPEDVERAVNAERKGDTLEKSPAFAPALPAYHSANQAFGYIDSKQIFESVYPLACRVLSFAGAMPGGNDLIDNSKLPATETISKHLQPIVYSQIRESNGYLFESSGPITMSQVLLLSLGAGVAYHEAGSQ